LPTYLKAERALNGLQLLFDRFPEDESSYYYGGSCCCWKTWLRFMQLVGNG